MGIDFVGSYFRHFGCQSMDRLDVQGLWAIGQLDEAMEILIHHGGYAGI